MQKLRMVRQRDGAILVLTVILLVVLIGMAALAIDVGQMYIARQRAQNVCDAAALAGVAYLDPGNLQVSRPVAAENANDCALGNNEQGQWKAYQPGTETEGVAVSFPDSTSIKAEADVKVEFLFAPVLPSDFAMTRVKAHAVARLETVQELEYPFLPLAITQEIVKNLSFGQDQALKTDRWQAGEDAFIGSGNFSPLQLDENGNLYKERLAGFDNKGEEPPPISLAVGERVDVMTGNKIGPTSQGIKARVESDKVFTDNLTAWDLWKQTWDPINMTYTPTPRLVLLPVIITPNPPLNGGSGTVEIAGFAAFFIERATEVKERNDVSGKLEEWVQIEGKFVEAAIGADALQPLWWMGKPGAVNHTLKARLVE